jgi:hypothetical protein
MNALADVNGDVGVELIRIPFLLKGFGVAFPVGTVVDNPSFVMLALVVGGADKEDRAAA